MRVRTEERRQAILEKAKEVFREEGFDRASMSEIAAKVGGSKATLYSYFQTKEELFAAAMRQSPEVGAVYGRFSDPNVKIASVADLRRLLEGFAFEHLKFALRPDLLAMRRNLFAHGDRSEASKHAFEAGPLHNFMLATAFLDRMMQDGYLRKDNPWVAWVHLFALVEAELMPQRLLGLIRDIPEGMIREATLRAVDAFFRAYGREKHRFPAVQYGLKKGVV